MNKIRIIILLFSLSNTLNAQYELNTERLKWWQEARFGMFIHFGTYSVAARGEWVKSVERLDNDSYNIYFNQFNPTQFDARSWAKLAKQAGMKYVVITAKHHEGFALWDTKLSEYKVTNSPFKRDLLKELLEALREEGLKVGLYFSLIDWNHPDYPKYNDLHHPMRKNEKYKDEKINWDNYLKFMHGQVRELCTNYGKIDLMWFDFSYGEMKGEKWKAKELVQMVRKLQPTIILNNRLSGDGSDVLDEASNLGDFETPEQFIPDTIRVNKLGQAVHWESCLTLNNSWGYNRYENNWKNPALVIHTLVNCVSKGGNLLLNVGPEPTGKIPEASVNILQEVGKWMETNHRSIYGCGPANIAPPSWGLYTQNGKYLYAHKMYPNIGALKIKNLYPKAKTAILLHDGSEMMLLQGYQKGENDKDLFLNLHKSHHATYSMPDDKDTVIEILLK